MGSDDGAPPVLGRRTDGSRFDIVGAPELPDRIDHPANLYLRPIGFAQGAPAEAAIALGAAHPFGANRSFAAFEVLIRGHDAVQASILGVRDAEAWAERIGAPAKDLIGNIVARGQALRATPPRVMGVVNVTPDSFSDGGDHADPEAAIAHGLRLVADGADLLDVGGESTRPGAAPIDPAVETARVVPVVRGLVGAGVPVSIDTRNAATMEAALEAGAAIINDVSALGHDPRSLAVAAAASCPVILMHSQGDPRTMQADPAYDCAPLDVFDALRARIEACEAAGLPRERLIVDPGIGFGKKVGHNLELLARIGVLHGLGCPILLGASRKSFIARLGRGEPPKERGPGGLAAALHGIVEGVAIVRVHDVAETVQAMRVAGSVTNVR